MNTPHFVSVHDYGAVDAKAFLSGEIGMYSNVTMALSFGGHKRALLNARLHGLRVIVMRPRQQRVRKRVKLEAD